MPDESSADQDRERELAVPCQEPERSALVDGEGFFFAIGTETFNAEGGRAGWYRERYTPDTAATTESNE